MTIFYGHNKNQTAQEAISVGYVAPSITPYLDLNPGFRLVHRSFVCVHNMTIFFFFLVCTRLIRLLLK